jgi:hypothetical protein
VYGIHPQIPRQLIFSLSREAAVVALDTLVAVALADCYVGQMFQLLVLLL